MTTVGGRSTIGALVAVTGWRVALAAVAWYGFAKAMHGIPDNIVYFSQLSTLAVAVVASVATFSPLWNGGRIEGNAGFLRGGAVTYATVTMLVFNFVMQGGLDTAGSRIEHLVVPLMAIADWLVVGHNQGRVRAWVPLLWLVPVAAYLPLYVGESHRRGHSLYGFLDPADTDFVGWVVGLLVAFAALGYLYWGLGRARRALLSPPNRAVTEPAVPSPS